MLMLLFSFLFLLFSFFFMNYWLILNFMFMLLFIFFMINMNNLMFYNISLIFSLDIYSFGLIFLMIWICSLNMMISINYYSFNMIYLLNNFILILILLMMFSVMNLFYFYLLFESSLIPILLMIIGWGNQVDRIQAGIYLLFYTMLFSIPMLICIMKIKMIMNTFYMIFILNLNDFMVYLLLILSFLVKMPMYFIHLWLLKAHTEAPLGGSMILAGILLKMGGYGIIRVMKFMINISLNLNILWMVISILGGVYVSIMCMIQMDMKLLIACSSIVHMSLVIGGLMTMSFWGMFGAYILMIGHGLSSSGLFILVNYYYELLLSRSLMISKGMLTLFPILTLWWFLMLSSNMASPPTLNLLGEISLFNSILNWSMINMIFIILISFFSVAYSLYIYTFCHHGKFLSGLVVYILGTYKDYLILIMHWLPMNFLILKFDFIFLLI
uniref:NADH-ubiquinone oxidoreductase chain 4 n=1 Tax=Nyctiophylax orbicularis TaxID=2904907 RepID=A0A9E8LP31_9NEOP|nr:NADH dehydrogenase subunit 4 [Nyctiophylax orbicularis]UZZ44205.1 NADH dehydrogenase subunit 4 [Nyctiophylax orbicularis]